MGVLYHVYCPRPVYGLIFLYKWRPGEEPQGTVVRDSRLQEIFFARQVSQDYCSSPDTIPILPHSYL